MNDDVTMAVTEGGSADDGDSKSETRGDPWDKCFYIMTSYGKEFCFVLAIVFTVYATTQNSPLKTQKLTIPKRFFPWNSFVTDYYLGTIEHAFERIAESDLTFVMYYASWDAISMKTRWIFDKTARHFQNEVQFIAINCWWPEGHCRRHFRRIHTYPVFMAYTGTGQGIQFRGPYTMPHMFRFLENLLHPLHPVFNFDDLINLQAKYDTVVAAYFDFESSPQPYGFQAYYNTALKALERDASLAVCFAILSSKEMAMSVGLNESKSIILFRFNETVNFTTRPKTESLITWTFKQRNATAQWLYPPSSKSLLLSNILEKSSPALILFTPQNPLVDSNPYFSLLNEIAMDYYNCNHSSKVQALIDQSIVIRNREQVNYRRRQRVCSESRRSVNMKDEYSIHKADSENSSCCYSVVIQHHPNNMDYKRSCDICSVHTKAQSCNHLQRPHLLSTVETIYSSSASVCKEFAVNYNPYHNVIACCRQLKTKIESDENATLTQNSSQSIDDRVMLLLDDIDEIRCRRMRLANDYVQLKFPVLKLPERRDFSGLGCRTNRTLVFIAIDSVQYEAILSNLGVNISKFYHETAVVIHHTKQEVQHLLNEVVTKHSLVEFITNFTNNQLSRHLRSSEMTEVVCQNGVVCLLEVTSQTFSLIVLDSHKDVLILYYASWCGFCSALFHIILEVADYFRSASDIVFARINGDQNDLPWEFTVERYPTILFFPAGKKMQSSVFPEDLAITVPNLIGFVFANIGAHTRLSMAIKSCSTISCIAKNRRRLLFHIQVLFGDVRILMARLRHIEAALHTGQGRKATLEMYKYQVTGELRKKRMYLAHSKSLHLTLIKTDPSRNYFPVDGTLQKYRDFQLERTAEKRQKVADVSSHIVTQAA